MGEEDDTAEIVKSRIGESSSNGDDEDSIGGGKDSPEEGDVPDLDLGGSGRDENGGRGTADGSPTEEEEEDEEEGEDERGVGPGSGGDLSLLSGGEDSGAESDEEDDQEEVSGSGSLTGEGPVEEDSGPELPGTRGEDESPTEESGPGVDVDESRKRFRELKEEAKEKQLEKMEEEEREENEADIYDPEDEGNILH
ncbi:MAG: hypothetical protein SVQ76_00965 [Candidatus Nanohaloarchaea archaeon]|nr:hypothetical protein [Candidatus Nanohaloarchaea archaeon]